LQGSMNFGGMNFGGMNLGVHKSQMPAAAIRRGSRRQRCTDAVLAALDARGVMMSKETPQR